MMTADEEAALRAVNRVADAGGVSLVIIGAGARILLFDGPNALVGRSTTDWDFAVRVESWAHYHRLVDQLCRDGQTEFEVISEHKVRHMPTSTMVDLVPFGGLATDDGEIIWPTTDRRMSVLGMSEAAAEAAQVEMGGWTVPVASIPCFIGLKLIAHHDRRFERDLQDVLFILDRYSDCEPAARFWELLEDGACAFEDAGPRALGEALGAAFSAPARARVVGHLQSLLAHGDQGALARLVAAMADDWDRRFEAICRKFAELLEGLQGRGDEG